jgi:hypothetical protein
MTQQPIAGQYLLTLDTTRSHSDTPHSDTPHSDTPHSLGLFWTSDLPVAKTSTFQHAYSKETDINSLGGVRTRNLSKRTDADPCLRPTGHWDRSYFCTSIIIFTR